MLRHRISRSEFSLPDGTMGKNVNIFGADITSSLHIDYKGKDLLILGEGPTQRLYDTTLTTEAKHPINFTQSGKRFVLNLHHNESNSFLFVNATKNISVQSKKSQLEDYALFLSNISKDVTINAMKKYRIKKSCKIFFC